MRPKVRPHDTELITAEEAELLFPAAFKDHAALGYFKELANTRYGVLEDPTAKGMEGVLWHFGKKRPHFVFVHSHFWDGERWQWYESYGSDDAL